MRISLLGNDCAAVVPARTARPAASHQLAPKHALHLIGACHDRPFRRRQADACYPFFRSRLPSFRQQAALPGDRDGLDAPFRSELLDHRRNMVVDRLHRAVDAARDGGIAQAVG